MNDEDSHSIEPATSLIPSSEKPILDVQGLTVTFRTARGAVRAVSDVSFSLRAGETLGIVGESGSGKTVTAMSVLNMVRKPGRVEGGQVLFRGQNLLALSEKEIRKIRGRAIGIVFQDPVTSLNPLMRVGEQIVETILAHSDATRRDAVERSVDLLEKVGIPDPRARLVDYPLAFSGGMSQRVMIAIALANTPDVIIADEPTTALDVTIQAQILELLATLSRQNGTAVILITHSLGIVARVCQRVAIMYAGKIVEEGRTEEIFANPRHPYTRDLLGAMPRLSRSRVIPLVAIDGRPPDLSEPIVGCAYAPRCQLAEARCHAEYPPTTIDAAGRSFACWVSAREGALPSHRTPAIGASRVTSMPTLPEDECLLAVRNVVKLFPVTRAIGGFRRSRSTIRAVDGVSFEVHAGETLGLVGESGCGKSTLAKVLLGIESPTSGSITYRGETYRGGEEVTRLRGRDLTRYNRHVQIIFQNPMSSLTPRMTVGDMITEVLLVHKLAKGREAIARVAALLELVGLDRSAASRFPHEFSGGQRQRIVIARALAVDPRLVVCDEAVSSLDVSLQAQIINLLRDLQSRLRLAYLFIGHDLATVRHVSHRMMVMYLGGIVESGPSELVTSNPQHPYTVSLLSAVPEPDPIVERTRERIVLTGEVPTALDPPSACRFHTRCPIGPMFRRDRSICATTTPLLAETSQGHLVACHFPGELAGVSREMGHNPPLT